MEPDKGEETLRRYSQESDVRSLDLGWAKVIAIIALAFSGFQLYTAIFGVLDAILQRAVHLSFGFSLIFLLFPLRRSWSSKRLHLVDVLLALIAAAMPLYVVLNYQSLILRAGRVTPMDFAFGLAGLLLLLEATRRVVGIPMVFISLIFLLYALGGRYLPGVLAHRGFALSDIVGHLFYTTEGIFGIPLGVSATFIFLFLLFSVFLERTGVGQLFIDLANAVAGRAVGGPAKVAVLSSGLMGMISGSSVANVVGTGSLTIPMMKRLGYRAEFAGAVEAVASTGGQLMPPIMGAAAFLMAEFTGLPYARIITAAFIPALLYYFGVWAGVHFEAKKLSLRGLTRAELPHLGEVLRQRGHLLLPLVAIVFLLVRGFTPMKAALWAILLSCVSAMLRKSTRINFTTVLLTLQQGARSALGVVAATACAGVIIGVVTLTGLGLKLGGSLVDLAGGNFFFTLVLTMLTSLLLGMGVPTTANYVITSTIAAPALMMMDAPIPLLAAHLFVFYFGIIADVTPPVALAAFAGAGIAGANPMRTGFEALKLAIAAFLVPYIFVYNPQMLLFDVTFWGMLHMALTALVGIVCVSSAVAGYLLCRQRWIERLIFFLGGVLLLIPTGRTDLIGLGLLLLGVLIQVLRTRKDRMTI